MGSKSCSALLAAAILLTSADAGEPEQAKGTNYRSPYSVQFTFPLTELTGDLQHDGRGDPRLESSVLFVEWYSALVRKRFGAWGPPARHYSPPEGLARRSVAWQRERVLAVALRFQGYDYQHHHLPDWDPPADWPWKPTRGGHNGKGMDCSNFTAFAYNLGLGIKPSGAVQRQAEQREVSGPGEDRVTRAERIDKPATYDELVRTLRTGDLLFIRNNEGVIGHVVLWVGSVGRSPNQVPLILDSHGEGVKDSNDAPIPHGIYLRPFRENSWYYRSANHALRYLSGG
jgi:hypothetical protein